MKYHDELKVNHWRMLNPISNLLIKLPLLLILLTFVEAQGNHPSLNDTQLQNMRLLNLDLLEKHKQIKKSNDLFSEVRDGRFHRVNEKAGMTAIELNEEYQRTLFRTKQVKNERKYSSQQAVYLIDTAIVITLSDTIQHTYERNSKGWVLVDLAVHGKGKQRTNIYRNNYTYDSTGNILRRLTEQWVPNEWRNYSRESSEYDQNGNVLLDVYEQWVNGAWMIDTRLTYDWDANGNMLLRVTEYGSDSGIVYDYKVTNKYNHLGYWISQLREVWEKDSWVNDYRNSGIFDEKGNMIYWLAEVWAIDHWVKNLQGYQTFTTSSKMLIESIEQWKDSVWIKWYRYVFAYDSQDRQISYQNDKWIDNQWVSYFRLEQEFDITGNKLSVLGQLQVNSLWQNDWKVSNVYDSNNNLIRSDSYLWQNSKWIYSNEAFWFSLDNNGLISNYVGIIFLGVYGQFKIMKNENIQSAFPSGISLYQNYPNPFNLSTKISFTLSNESHVNAMIYNVLGQNVAILFRGKLKSGQSDFMWIADQPSGLFFCRVDVYESHYLTFKFSKTIKMILLK